MDNKECPKCGAKWPKNCKYCICGTKLDLDILDLLNKVYGVDTKKEEKHEKYKG